MTMHSFSPITLVKNSACCLLGVSGTVALTSLVFTTLVAASTVAYAQSPAPVGETPTKEDCLAFIAILPTFQSKAMSDFYESNPEVSAKGLVEKIESLANSGDTDLQFTYAQLLLNGYCVPKDFCAAQRYFDNSRAGSRDWSKSYPTPNWPISAASSCK
jgi:hypothetical protein